MRGMGSASSKRRSLRHGPGRLVVDGRGDTVVRKATFAFNPSAGHERAFHRLLSVCCEVYNAALQERRDAYRATGVTVTWQDQFNQVRHLRGVRDDALAFGVQPVRGAIMRCDEAMQAFFQRLRAGATPGYPRFKGKRRFNTACWDEPVSWKIIDGGRTLRVQRVGQVSLPKSARRQIMRMIARGGQSTTLTITRRRAGRGWAWRATVGFTGVTVEATPPARGDGSVAGADRGVKVALATSDGKLLVMPRHVAAARDRIVVLQRAQDRKKRGSRKWRRLGRQIAQARQKAAAQTDNWARETAAVLVADYAVLVMEDLNLAAMTRSASGTVEKPGTNVAQKQGLNRELQDAALGRLAVRICVKAESAGRRVWMVNPANTSRACPLCGHSSKANRPDQATFTCQGCGHVAHADTNAAVNIATRGRQCEQAWQAAGAPSLPHGASRRRGTHPRSQRERELHRGRVGSEATCPSGALPNEEANINVISLTDPNR